MADVERLLAPIRGSRLQYSRPAVDAILAHRDLVAAPLVAMLAEVARDPEAWLKQPDPPINQSRHAIALLGWMGEATAHPWLLRVARTMSADDFGVAFGPFVLGGLDLALAWTCAGDVTGVHQLLTDSAADPSLKAQAAEALGFAAHLGLADRERVLDWLAAALEVHDQPHDYVVSAMLKLCPLERADLLRATVRRPGWTWPTPAYVEEQLARPGVADERWPFDHLVDPDDLDSWFAGVRDDLL
jgi:hypothetical protein